MKLLHLANFNSTNVGNGALISGTERTLKEDLGTVEFHQEAWDDYTFGLKKYDQKLIDLINSTDGIIIGGAVTLNGQSYQKNTGTRFELPLDQWNKIEKPIIFYGISYRHWPWQRFHNLKRLKETFRLINQSRNILFSVRNDGTKDWLEEILGFKIPKMKIIPDPALYLKTDNYRHPELVSDKKNIILSLNNEDEVYRFGGWERFLIWQIFGKILPEKILLKLFKKIPFWDRKKKIMFAQIARALETVSQKYQINIILTPHYFDDFKAISEFIPICPLRFPHQNIISTGMSRVKETGYFYDLYGKADLAISMRVHSMSPSIALNTPMIALSSQSRMTEFLKNAGLEKYGLNIFDNNLSEMLSNKIDSALANPALIKANFKNALLKMREETRKFNLEICDFISKTKEKTRP